MKNHFILYVILAIGAFSCDVPIVLDVDQTTPIPVIEAQVTNKIGSSYIHITETVPFYYEGSIPRRTDAIITLTDEFGIVTGFDHYIGLNPDSIGFYFPPMGFVAETGLTYTLKVAINGINYLATDTMMPINPIDSITYNIREPSVFDPIEDDEKYEILLYTKEPPETKDYYMFKFFKNYEITRNSETDIYVFEDIALSENLDGLPAPIYYAENDTSVVEMFSITRAAFVYYSDLQIVLTNDGGMFSPPPANPRTNFSESTPGFFLLASVVSDTLVIK